jgi:hypothetical protein
MQPAFHRKRLAAFVTLMTSATVMMLDQWQAIAEGNQRLDVAAEMLHLTLRISPFANASKTPSFVATIMVRASVMAIIVSPRGVGTTPARSAIVSKRFSGTASSLITLSPIGLHQHSQCDQSRQAKAEPGGDELVCIGQEEDTSSQQYDEHEE